MKLHEDLFKRHKHLGTFIETGTCYGRSVEAAIALGFTDIRSVEAQSERYEHCKKLFSDKDLVRLWFGESVDRLPLIIADLKVPALFWLDAHTSGIGKSIVLDKDIPSYCGGLSQSEIIKLELAIIEAHPVKGHVILIDDLTPDIFEFCAKQFNGRDLTAYTITEGPLKVLEII